MPSRSLPCGDISPTVGITGTPVLDEARGEVFVVADELVNGSPAHHLVGLSTATGTVELNQNVDPSGSTPAAILQRTGLTLDAGHVVFGYGGNFGDCSTYHGWVMSVPEAGGTPADVRGRLGPGESQGAIWMGGAAPVVDAGGNIWVVAGNGSVTSTTHAYDHSDSVLELSPSLTLTQYFAPSTWASENASDLDLSTGVALLADGQVVAAGKDRVVYLLDGSKPGWHRRPAGEPPRRLRHRHRRRPRRRGHDRLPALPERPDRRTGHRTPPPGSVRCWSASVGGGPPIVAGGLVWTIGSNGVLYGLNPSTGAVREQATIGAPANHFPTPSVGAGLLLAPSADHVGGLPGRLGCRGAPPRRLLVRRRPRRRRCRRVGTDPWIVVAAIAGGLDRPRRGDVVPTAPPARPEARTRRSPSPTPE